MVYQYRYIMTFMDISTFIHPASLQYFSKQSFGELNPERLNKRYIANALCICPQSAVVAIDYFKARNANYVYSQIEMHALKEPVSKTLPEINMRLATSDDLITLAKIGSTSFGSPFTEVLQRFIENQRDKNRKAWLVSINNESIGKIHVRFEENKTAFIHDLCIVPEHRGKNYATTMILQTMDIIRKEGYKHITLDVELHNEGALKLYEQCGFKTVAGYEFWQLPVSNFS